MSETRPLTYIIDLYVDPAYDPFLPDRLGTHRMVSTKPMTVNPPDFPLSIACRTPAEWAVLTEVQHALQSINRKLDEVRTRPYSMSEKHDR